MYHFKLSAITTLLVLTYSSAIAANDSDWRKNSSHEQKLINLVKVIPSTSDLMIQMGERYRNLYWAGKQGKWQFAQYQLEEMGGLIKTLKITRPKRAASIKESFGHAFEPVEAAIKNKNWGQFSRSFETMRSHCIACHKANNHAFIVLKPKPSKGNSPTLD